MDAVNLREEKEEFVPPKRQGRPIFVAIDEGQELTMSVHYFKLVFVLSL